jgi:hypothetical protein
MLASTSAGVRLLFAISDNQFYLRGGSARAEVQEIDNRQPERIVRVVRFNHS